MSRPNRLFQWGANSLLLFWIALPAWGQEHPSEPVAHEIAPLPELIDLWDAAKIRARRPLLIAHRGGVVVGGAPECSQLAVKLAAAHRYDMVELDVMASEDHHPVVFHDESMVAACGIDGQISDFTLEAVTQLRFLKSDQAITSLDTMLGLCRSLNLGVMFDIKSADGDDLFFTRVRGLIEKHELDKACMSLGNSRALRGQLKDKVLLTLPREMLERVKHGESIDLHGYYWFGVPTTWSFDLIKPVQDNGALVIPALNTFRYSKEHHRVEVREIAERLLKAGADGFQIDCIYQDYFGRPVIRGAEPVAALAIELTSLPPGTSEIQVKHDGQSRRLIITTPRTFGDQGSYPVLFCFHGAGGKADGQSRRWRPHADERDLIVISAEAVQPLAKWNFMDGFHADDHDDVGFVAKVIEALIASRIVDPKSIYATGHSSGGLFCYRLAKELDLFAALSPMSCGMVMGAHDPGKKTKPVSIMQVIGDQDKSFNGSSNRRVTMYSAVKRIDVWREFNRCGPDPVVGNKGEAVVVYTYANQSGVEVAYCKVKGQGHHIRKDLRDGADHVALDFLLRHKQR